jgi:periplasmic copper chaperone A
MSRHPKAPHFRATTNAVCRIMLPMLLALLLLAACDSTEETPASAAVQITLRAGQAGNELQVHLRDAAQSPITDATVTLEGNMNHAGMAPVLTDPVQDSADGAADGIYHVPFQFAMLGDWIVTVTAVLANGAEATKAINVTATDAGIQIEGDSSSGANQSNTQAADGQMMLHNIMAPATPLAGGNGAIYLMVMNNTGQTDRLVAIESGVAAAAEMHESVEENNIIRMEPGPAGFEIPANGSVTLAPGGKHVMLVNLKQPLVEGESFTATLRFEYAPPISITVPIVAPGTVPAGDHQHGG